MRRFGFEYAAIKRWPRLAWVARCRTGRDRVEVLHGSGVEIGPGWFCEAVWDGDFEAGAFDRTSVVFGTGGKDPWGPDCIRLDGGDGGAPSFDGKERRSLDLQLAAGVDAALGCWAGSNHRRLPRSPLVRPPRTRTLHADAFPRVPPRSVSRATKTWSGMAGVCSRLPSRRNPSQPIRLLSIVDHCNRHWWRSPRTWDPAAGAGRTVGSARSPLATNPLPSRPSPGRPAWRPCSRSASGRSWTRDGYGTAEQASGSTTDGEWPRPYVCEPSSSTAMRGHDGHCARYRSSPQTGVGPRCSSRLRPSIWPVPCSSPRTTEIRSGACPMATPGPRATPAGSHGRPVPPGHRSPSSASRSGSYTALVAGRWRSGTSVAPITSRSPVGSWRRQGFLGGRIGTEKRGASVWLSRREIFWRSSSVPDYLEWLGGRGRGMDPKQAHTAAYRGRSCAAGAGSAGFSNASVADCGGRANPGPISLVSCAGWTGFGPGSICIRSCFRGRSIGRNGDTHCRRASTVKCWHPGFLPGH